MDARTIVVLNLIFGLGSFVIFMAVRRMKHPLSARLLMYSLQQKGEENEQSSVLRESKKDSSGRVSKFAEYTQLKLLRAGEPTDLLPFMTRMGIFALVGIAICGLLTGYLGIFLGAILGGVFPYILLHIKFKRRMAKFEYDLPTALQFIVNALRAGHALNSSIAIVGSEGPAGCREDFVLLNDSLRLGVPPLQAFEQMLQRTPSVDLQFMTTAMLIQRETGGNLTEILDRLKSVVLERKQLRGQLKALTAQVRLGGYVVGALPFILGLSIFFLNPEYMTPMIETTLGHYLLGGALFMQFLGLIAMKKIINIKM